MTRDTFKAKGSNSKSPPKPRSKKVKCGYCGAPCKEVVLMRGGENGWGDDASRTVCKYDEQSKV